MDFCCFVGVGGGQRMKLFIMIVNQKRKDQSDINYLKIFKGLEFKFEVCLIMYYVAMFFTLKISGNQA